MTYELIYQVTFNRGRRDERIAFNSIGYANEADATKWLADEIVAGRDQSFICPVELEDWEDIS